MVKNETSFKFKDIEAKCVDCGQTFTIIAGGQRFFLNRRVCVQGGGEIMVPNGGLQLIHGLQWPLPIAGSITSRFGYRTDPLTSEVSYHSGTDIAAPNGMPILAAADGTATIANGIDSWGGSYWYHVQIDHGGGWKLCMHTAPRFASRRAYRYRPGRSFSMWEVPDGQRRTICISKH